MRPSVQLLNLPLFVLYLLLLYILIGISLSWMSLMHFYMEFYQEKFIWSSLSDLLIQIFLTMFVVSRSLCMALNRLIGLGFWSYLNLFWSLALFLLLWIPPYLFITKVMSTCSFLSMLMTGTHPSYISSLICRLQLEFKMKDLGDLNYFLGIQVHRDASSLHLRQTKYINYLLHRSKMACAKPYSSPYSSGLRLSASDGESLAAVQVTEYRQIVGALQYCTLTHSDIAFSCQPTLSIHAQPYVFSLVSS